MAKIKHFSVKSKKYNPVPGTVPGKVDLTTHTLKPKITVYTYNEVDYITLEIDSYSLLETHLEQHSAYTHWIDIRGLGDLELFQFIQAKFNIHPLAIEDIVNTYQRPKLDEYEHYLFAISRLLYVNENKEIENEQVSFILLQNVLFTLQENYTDKLNVILPRIKTAKSIIRTGGTSYMMYALMDIIIDNYFALIYKMGDELDSIEAMLYRRSDKSIMFRTQEIKRVMIAVRRAAWPERDKINDMIRSESGFIENETKAFLKDAYDHCMQVVDLVESYKDVTTTLVDMNLSIISNRMNEVMKVLTIISSIFIPLTFIAGIYGMNFAREDPETHKQLPHNMPELYSENGYIYTLLVMLLIAVLQIIYFWRKGWLK